MDNKLKSFLEVIPCLKDIIHEDVMCCVTDTTHFLGYYPGNKIKMDLTPGEKIPDGDPLQETIRSNKIIAAIVSKEVYGFPFKAVTYPIRNDQGQVIGAVGFAKSLEHLNKIEEASSSLFTALEQVNASVQEVAADSQNLSSSINNVVESANVTHEKINEIDNVINIIKNISSQSNLLGLNAAIEAARAGEQGKGFSVVAEEMRKLASISNDSAKKVSDTLMQMKRSIETIITQINKTGEIAENQAAAAEEVTAALQEITSNSEKLTELIRN